MDNKDMTINKDEVKISAPWGRGNVNVQRGGFINKESTKHFVEERSKVHTVYILEQEKTKRLSLILATFLLVSAMLMIVFAPPDKEVVSYWIGGALLIFSAGAAGYRRIWAKAPLIEVKGGE